MNKIAHKDRVERYQRFRRYIKSEVKNWRENKITLGDQVGQGDPNGKIFISISENEKFNIDLKNLCWSSSQILWWKCSQNLHLFFRSPKKFFSDGFLCPICEITKSRFTALDITWNSKTSCYSSAENIIFSKLKVKTDKEMIEEEEAARNKGRKFIHPMTPMVITKEDEQRHKNWLELEKERDKVLRPKSRWKEYTDSPYYWECQKCNFIQSVNYPFSQLFENIHYITFLENIYGICSKCNIKNYTKGLNDIETVFWEYLTFWNEPKNGTLADYNKNAYQYQDIEFSFQCICGRTWNSILDNLELGHHCEFCNIPMERYHFSLIDGMQFEKIFSEIDITEIREQINFKTYKYFFYAKLTWRCQKDTSHTWDKKFIDRIINPDCPYCVLPSASQIEVDFLEEIKNHIPDIKSNLWVEDLRWPLKLNSSRKKGNPMKFDMVSINQKIAIEYDGKIFHDGTKSKKTKDEAFQHDMIKTEALLKLGWKVIRIREAPLGFLENRIGMYQISHDNNGRRNSIQYVSQIKMTVDTIMKDFIPLIKNN